MSALFCCNGSNSTAYGISTAVKSSTPCIACRTASCKPTRITTTCAVGIRTTGKPIRRSTKPASIAAARSSRGSKARDRRGSGAGHRAARPAAGSAPAAVLYVSARKRGQGLGKQLFQLCLRQAAQEGAAGLYISSIPNKSTVDFYLAQGCRLIERPDAELFAREPEDIHLVCPCR